METTTATLANYMYGDLFSKRVAEGSPQVYTSVYPKDGTVSIIRDDCATGVEPAFKQPLARQVGGDHYKKYPIQPIEYCIANNLGPLEHGVVKYVTRHPDKGEAEDIRKAIHYLELILHFRYGK